MLAQKLLSSLSGASGAETLYVDDVFSAFTYTSTGSETNISPGIDLLGKGGIAWLKGRSVGSNYGYGDHEIFCTDYEAGQRRYLRPNGTDAIAINGTLKASGFTSTGIILDAGPETNNRSGDTNVGWLIRKAPKFFDCGTYTGNGVAGRQIAHSLGVAPGMVIVKRTDVAGTEWLVYHRSVTATGVLVLNNTDAVFTSSGYFNTPSDAFFSVQAHNGLNASGGTYVWYAIAHDSSADGIVQCGSFTTDGSGNATVNLGWEPQYLMAKASSATGSWLVFDTMRAWGMSTDEYLLANTSGAAYGVSDYGNPTAAGFTATSYSASTTYIYLAIRRPNKPPTTGTQVYNAIARTGTGAAATVTGVGFAPDVVLIKNRLGNTNSVDWSYNFFDRLRGGGRRMSTAFTDAEDTATSFISSLDMNGMTLPGVGYTATNGSYDYINHFFKRAPGVFSICAYTGTGGTNAAVNHDLGVIPDLVIIKCRSNARAWLIRTRDMITNNQYTRFDSSAAQNNSVQGYRNISQSTASVFYTDDIISGVNSNTYVAYLFANAPGIQYIGTYVGDGTSGRIINCGFTTGSRFVCIKAISTTGDWLISDTARGIIAGNDPRLSLNTTAAEVTSEDWLDPHSSGFIVNQVSGSNANVNGVTYLVWTIA